MVSGAFQTVNITGIADRAVTTGSRRRTVAECLSLSGLAKCVNDIIARELATFKYGPMSLNQVEMTGSYDQGTKIAKLGLILDVKVDLVAVLGDVIDKVR